MTTPLESPPAITDAAREANECGAALAHQGRFREAAAVFDEACDFDLENAKGCSKLGVVLRRLNDLNGAIVQFEQAIRLRPEFTEAHYKHGNAYSTNMETLTRRLANRRLRQSDSAPR